MSPLKKLRLQLYLLERSIDSPRDILFLESLEDLHDLIVPVMDFVNDSTVESRLRSLETRYSECLYYLKDKNK